MILNVSAREGSLIARMRPMAVRACEPVFAETAKLIEPSVESAGVIIPLGFSMISEIQPVLASILSNTFPAPASA